MTLFHIMGLDLVSHDITWQIKNALSPLPQDLPITTKVGRVEVA